MCPRVCCCRLLLHLLRWRGSSATMAGMRLPSRTVQAVVAFKKQMKDRHLECLSLRGSDADRGRAAPACGATFSLDPALCGDLEAFIHSRHGTPGSGSGGSGGGGALPGGPSGPASMRAAVRDSMKRRPGSDRPKPAPLIPPAVLAVLKGMLHLNPVKRLTAAQALALWRELPKVL